jgi:hypothetical protein
MKLIADLKRFILSLQLVSINKREKVKTFLTSLIIVINFQLL